MSYENLNTALGKGYFVDSLVEGMYELAANITFFLMI